MGETYTTINRCFQNSFLASLYAFICTSSLHSSSPAMSALVDMFLVQLGVAGVTIASKVAMDRDLDPFLLAVYSQVAATLAAFPFSLVFERERPPMNREIFFRIFLCSLFGATCNQLPFLIGLKNTTTILTFAMSNVLPAFTFIFGVIFRQENVGIESRAGQSKVVGTAASLGGAALLCFYYGPAVGIRQPKIGPYNVVGSGNSNADFFVGPFLLIVSSVSLAIWLNIQQKMVTEIFDAPYTTTTIMTIMSALECTIVASFFDQRHSVWNQSVTYLIAIIYVGIIGLALGFCLMTRTIKKKGPLYISAFGPLILIFMALFSCVSLREEIHLGTVVGSILIVSGLLVILWGKSMEIRVENEEDNEDNNVMVGEAREVTIAMEMQPSVRPNG